MIEGLACCWWCTRSVKDSSAIHTNLAQTKALQKRNQSFTFIWMSPFAQLVSGFFLLMANSFISYSNDNLPQLYGSHLDLFPLSFKHSTLAQGQSYRYSP